MDENLGDWNQEEKVIEPKEGTWDYEETDDNFHYLEMCIFNIFLIQLKLCMIYKKKLKNALII